jgi:aldehyde dehydrogenase (NAD+)
MPTAELFERLGLRDDPRIVARVGSGEPPAGTIYSENPATGEPISGVKLDDATSCENAIAGASETFRTWRLVPAPVRGQVVRAIAEEYRKHRADLGDLVSLEVGKIRAEGVGEVQETIDIADFAVGLSRMLHGITMPSERPEHRMMEQWHPLGPSVSSPRLTSQTLSGAGTRCSRQSAVTPSSGSRVSSHRLRPSRPMP